MWASKYKGVSRSEYLSNPVLQQHRVVKNKVFAPIVAAPDSYQADLMFFDSLKRYNSGYSMILNVIEITTRKLYAYPLKSKSDCYDAFADLLSKITMNKLTTDAGSEFMNHRISALFAKHDVTVINSPVKTHVAIVERVNRTMRNLIERYLTLKGNYRWLDALDELVDMYNNSVHASTGVAPNKITLDDELDYRLKQRIKTLKIQDHIRRVFTPGRLVRMKVVKGAFEKGATANWSSELYKVVGVKGFRVIISDMSGSQQSVIWYNLLPVRAVGTVASQLGTVVQVKEKDPEKKMKMMSEISHLPSRAKLRKERANEQLLARESMLDSNIVEGKRVRMPSTRLKGYEVYR